MADPLDECPAYVKSRSFWSDTLEANVPYRNVDENPITVPPIASLTNPFESNVIWRIDPTIGDGKKRSSSPGWNDIAEQTTKSRLTALIATVKAEGAAYPEVRSLVDRLVESARSDLTKIDALYDDWASVSFWAAYSTNPLSCWALHKVPRNLWGRFDIPIAGSSQTKNVLIQGRWGACPLDLDKEWPYLESNILRPKTQQEVIEGFDAVKDLLGPELMGRYDIYNATVEELWDAINEARARDRRRISELLRHAYESIWCAEYGVAQGESYAANKKTWQERYGDMPVLVTPPAGKRPDIMIPGGPAFEAPHIPEECLLFGTNCPTREPGPGLGTGPAAPPVEEPVPEPAVAGKWYQTVAGKIGIAVATLTVVGASGYGIYYARQRA